MSNPLRISSLFTLLAFRLGAHTLQVIRQTPCLEDRTRGSGRSKSDLQAAPLFQTDCSLQEPLDLGNQHAQLGDGEFSV